MTIQLERDDLLNAIKHIDKNPKIKSGRHSSTYDLVYENKKYPPILVLSVAHELKGGEEITLSDFKNNIEIPFKILREKGFEIQPKAANNKSEYINWAKEKLSIRASTQQQYVTSLGNLSKIISYNIFENNNIEEINDLYNDLLNEQKNRGGKYYEKERPSASLKGWYSASVKTYLDFLKNRYIKTENQDDSFKANEFYQSA